MDAKIVIGELGSGMFRLGAGIEFAERGCVITFCTRTKRRRFGDVRRERPKQGVSPN